MEACSPAGGNDPGHEYMPDMGHQVAYEANTYDYYRFNRWGGEQSYYDIVQPRIPVKGTIARGHAGKHSPKGHRSGVNITNNGAVPYYYGDTEEERTRATNEITTNPYPITDAGLDRGKELYIVNCAICHGEKGDGDGWLVSESNPNAVYPAQPALFTTDDFINSSEGRYYHSIMYGKNVMGAYNDKLSYEERWQVIHYIRALQAKEKGLAYNELENTFNSVGIPASTIPMVVKTTVHDATGSHDSDHDAHGMMDEVKEIIEDHIDHGDDNHDVHEHH